MGDGERIKGSLGAALLTGPRLATLAWAGRGSRAASTGAAGGGTDSSKVRPGYSMQRWERPHRRFIRRRAAAPTRGRLSGTAGASLGSLASGAGRSVGRTPEYPGDRHEDDPRESEATDLVIHSLAQNHEHQQHTLPKVYGNIGHKNRRIFFRAAGKDLNGSSHIMLRPYPSIGSSPPSDAVGELVQHLVGPASSFVGHPSFPNLDPADLGWDFAAAVSGSLLYRRCACHGLRILGRGSSMLVRCRYA
jgi:hypothetical protein